MRGVTLKAPINEFSGSFFVTNSTDGELHDFWITEHCGEHRNVLMGQLPCNQPLCFKQWHLSLPVHNAWLCGVPERQRRRVRQQPLVRSRHVRAMLVHTQTNKEPLYPRNSRKLRSMATIWLRGTVLKRPSLDIK